jgi:hypothetical protein
MIGLARLDPGEFRIEARAARPELALALVVGKVEIYLPLTGMIDVEREKARLDSEIAKAQAEIVRGENLLGGEFAKRAPAAVVQKTRDSVAAARERLAKLETQLASLEGKPAAPQESARKRVTTKRATAKKAPAKQTPARKTAKKKRARTSKNRTGVRSK